MDRNIYVSISPSYLVPKPPKPPLKTVESVVQEKLPPSNVGSDTVEIASDAVKDLGGADRVAEVGEEENTTGKKRKANEAKEKLSLKKRHQKTHPDKEDRLCGFITRGESCPYPNCQYSHDVIGYLAKKPADIGPSCVNYEQFGFCSSGVTCRFGDSHINRETGANLSRPVEQGGIIERNQINLLSKTTQLMLRKKQLKELCASSSTPYPDQPVKLVDFRNKVYIAPLTTVGNLPFRRVMKDFGADITCGEMAMASNILSAQASEWALLRRHQSEDCFGVQVAGPYPSILGDLSQLLEHEVKSDFVDLNCACPIDVVYSRGSGSALMQNHKRLCDIVRTMSSKLPSRSVTVKVRIGHDEKNPTTHKLVPMLQNAAPGRMAALMIHGRSKLQRYHKLANWDYIYTCAKAQDPNLPLIPIIGNGDIFSFNDWKQHLHMMTDSTPAPSNFVNAELANQRNEEKDSELLGLCSCAMLARGALIKPWLPMELKEQTMLDISASQRLDMMRSFCNYGLEHWGSDDQGVATTRRFLLEWLSFLHRYVPAGLLEHKSADLLASRGSTRGTYLGQPIETVDLEQLYAQTMNQRPPSYFGRSDMETLLASPHSEDWIRISEMFLGPVKENFHFIPKHKSNSYAPTTSTSAGASGNEVPTEPVDSVIDEDPNNG